MSWSTSIKVEAAEDELPVLTPELIEQARQSVIGQLDEYREHDTFNGAIAAAVEMLQYGPGTRLVTLGGHASAVYRSCTVSTSVPLEDS